MTLTKSGRGPMGSSKSQVILSGLAADGRDVLHGNGRLSKGAQFKDNILHLQVENSSASFLVTPKHHLQFDFFTYNFAGDSTVDICGDIEDVYLYTSNDINQWSQENRKVLDKWYITEDGTYTIKLDLPRYRIENILVQVPAGFSVSSFDIINEFDSVLSFDDPISADIGLVYQLSEMDKKRQRLFHPHRLFWQFLFASLTVFAIHYISGFVRNYDTARSVLTRESRWLFWGMCITGFIVFGFWHIAFWPGIASTDSLKIWRAAQIPGMYLGDHPPLNVIFYMYLSMFWNNMAIVPLFQNISCSVLISSIYFSMYRWGLSKPLVIVFFLLTVLSVPVGTYNAVLWKDVPFAFAVVLLAFHMARMYFGKRHENRQIQRKDWQLVIILLILIAGMRYNGAVYFLVIPALMIGLGMVHIRWKYVLLIIPVLVLLGISVAMAPKLSSSASFVGMQVSRYVTSAFDDISPEFVGEKFDQYMGVFDVNQDDMQWDHLHNCFWWRYNNSFLKRVKWNDVYPYISLKKEGIQKKIANLAVKIYKISYTTPFVYFSWNPVYMLYLLIIVPFLIRWLPMSAVFSFILLSQVAALVFLGILNWRYYYFAFMGLNFLVPLMITDRVRMKTNGAL
ncbi:hypothetical protein [Desulfopila sp. IMCC35008]|uniref:hypothetical protein n=1 Tax=Desulfopila sp. IMCC35008 TaxID=2653858 RepID=UPI0013D4E188|nr:hypothetical protein [Desulfopila sp. IMCC35008]